MVTSFHFSMIDHVLWISLVEQFHRELRICLRMEVVAGMFEMALASQHHLCNVFFSLYVYFLLSILLTRPNSCDHHWVMIAGVL